jgi:hypothetical protein
VSRKKPSRREAGTFLVERYWPGVDEDVLRRALRRLERAIRSVRAEGGILEHAGSILVPSDEVVLSVFRADSEGTVRGVNELAGVPLDRIAEVTAHGFGTRKL